MDHNIYGKVGENLACKYLKEHGYNIIHTNYRNKLGEIDIIAMDGACLVFVEVKSRLTKEFGDPLEAVNMKKQQKIRRVAQLFLMSKRAMNVECRFDVIGITGQQDDYEIVLVKNAF